MPSLFSVSVKCVVLGPPDRHLERWSRQVKRTRAFLVRARFCELLAGKVPHGSSDLFLMGLRSLMDAILEIPMPEVLDDVPLDQETKAVLSGAARPLRPLLSTEAGA